MYFILLGEIPSVMQAMPNIVVLYLNSNFLYGGNISSFVAPTMTDLSLSQNQFSGHFPFENPSISLKSIYIRQNYLTGSISVNLTALIHVEKMDFSYNMMTGTLPTALDMVSRYISVQMYFVSQEYALWFHCLLLQ